MRYKPKIGDEFELTNVVLAKTKHVTELTRSVIALSVVLLGILALLITGALGAYRGDFQALQMLWAVIAAPLGWVIGHYFRGASGNDQKDNTSAA
jgi:hypothetical protein